MSAYVETLCLLCDSNENTHVKFAQNFKTSDLNAKIFSARRTTEHFHYRFLECKKCEMVYSSPILPHNEITKLYEESLQTYDNQVSDICDSYMQYIIKRQELLFSKNRALEIGCGNGFFLHALEKFGFKEVHGVEPSHEAFTKSGEMQPSIFNGMIENADYPKNHFDLICCFQTLDHLVNPLEVLKRVHELLAPEGVAYFIVHNEQGAQAKFFGENSPIYDVEHVYLFNKKTLPQVCQKAGLQPLEVFSVKNIYPLSYWIRMAPIPFKSFFSNMFKWLGMSNMKIGIHPGNIGIFVRKSSGTLQ